MTSALLAGTRCDGPCSQPVPCWLSPIGMAVKTVVFSAVNASFQGTCGFDVEGAVDPSAS